MNLTELYDIADENKINVYCYPLKTVEALSMPGNIFIDDNAIKTLASEKTHLAHELGHCMTGAFYTVDTYETRGRIEARANRWAFKNAVPLDQLKTALDFGITELWELAEYFDVEEQFIVNALKYYKCQNLI